MVGQKRNHNFYQKITCCDTRNSEEVKNNRKEDWDEKDLRNSLNRGQWTSALAAIPAALQLFNNHADWMIKGLKWLSHHDLILFEVEHPCAWVEMLKEAENLPKFR